MAANIWVYIRLELYYVPGTDALVLNKADKHNENIQTTYKFNKSGVVYLFPTLNGQSPGNVLCPGFVCAPEKTVSDLKVVMNAYDEP